ncbi:hypothetical protein [Chryseobacterium sp.]|uniref:hypothetical protein n=1 Tax=Chryseobacterium sp. TaxID=1871047 RepID=UPI0025C187B7|nr:hypothetical protein [Chryseobacterium sp.]MBV8326688.1 hypothetical protein [Chryseobacterium sp.]
MKKLLFLSVIFFAHLCSCQLTRDSIIVLRSNSSLIYPSFSPSCYRTGDYNKKYQPQDMLFVTDITECKGYSSTKDIIGFYFDGKKYYMEDNSNENEIYVKGKQKQLADIKTKFNNLTPVEKDSLDSWSKRFSEVYMRKLKNEVYDKIFSREKNGIAIISAFPTEDYSFTGAEFKILNFSKKTIKYITFNFYGKNAVKDRVGVNISRKGIGPVESLASGTWSFDNVWLTDIVQTLKLVSVNIIYMDGSKRLVTITDKHRIDQEDLDRLNNLMD